jgi:hypothetical protein
MGGFYGKAAARQDKVRRDKARQDTCPGTSGPRQSRVIQELFAALTASTLFTDPGSAALVAGAVFVAYVAFGVSGFGSALIAVPVIAHVWPLTAVVPLFALFEIVAAIAVGGSHWRTVDRRELMTLLPFMLGGIAIGVTLLLSLPSPWLLVGLGAFVLVYGLRGALRKNRAFAKVSRLWAVPTGLVGGVMSALFGTGGSFYMIYVAGRVEDKGALRATISTVLGTSNAVRLVVFIAAGLLAPAVLFTALTLLPVVFAGLWLGGRLHARVTRDQIIRGICVLLVASGASLLVRAIGQV